MMPWLAIGVPLVAGFMIGHVTEAPEGRWKKALIAGLGAGSLQTGVLMIQQAANPWGIPPLLAAGFLLGWMKFWRTSDDRAAD